MKNSKYVLLALIMITLSCRDFLEEKPDWSLATAETIEANQALLDNERFINSGFAHSGETSSDDIYLSDAEFNALPYEELQRLYTWQPDRVMPPITQGNDWFNCFQAILYCNTVLHNIEKYGLTGKEADDLKGQALAQRAARFLDGLQVWAPVYNPATAKTDLGLPLRLDPDMNIPSVRASVEETYRQVIKDLEEAVPLVPVKPISSTRMSRPAALGLLARTHLFMGDYPKALSYAMQALQLNSTLMNYNTINAAAVNPISDTNPEILSRAIFFASHLRSPRIQPSLYNSYDENDLRKKVLFRKDTSGDIIFKGHYGNIYGDLSGIAVDELFLIAAEANARAGNTQAAMDLLNTLLVTRWKTGTFVPYTAANKEEALQKVLAERRKELLLRGLRWSDLKRLNRDGANITLQRTVNGQTFVLPPNDKRYAIALPEDVVELSGMQQNPR